MTRTITALRPLAGTAAAVVLGISLAGASLSGAALAAGEASSGTATTTTAMKCKDGQVWDGEAKTLLGKGKCVDAAAIKKDDTKKEPEKQGMIYERGKELAKAGKYQQAIAMLELAPDQNDPRVQNYLGYSNRKLGNMDVALAHYHQAVASNPDFSLVREYLGEAYVQLGLLEKAREQLTEIERICGSRSCGEYGQLAAIIVDSQLN
ncbi:MAG: tetratricopeptide repeat protein [Nitratireductor sp.]